MSAVRSLTETVRTIPRSEPDAPTEPDLYRYRNCGRDVDADECSNCSSTNLRPLAL